MTVTETLKVEASTDRRTTTDVEIVIPVYNEEAVLESSVRRLHRYLRDRFPLSWTLIIADNASVDQTWAIACRLAGELEGVRAVHMEEKGRGRALRAAWSASAAAVVAYMDVDLSTDLDALLPLVAPLLSGHSDVAIGSRLAPGARVVRGPKREVISRGYNLVLKAILHNGFSDAQCGFKAARRDVARALLPLVEDDGWFFDTELLVLAEHNSLRIHEVPVDWVDDPDSRVDIAGTVKSDLKGIWRMVRRFAAGAGSLAPGALTADEVTTGLASQLARFAAVGAVTTVIFAVLFILLAGHLGSIPANVVAMGLATATNLTANRRITFARRGRPGRLRHYGTGLAVAALPLVLTVTALLGLEAAGVSSIAIQLGALSVVNGLATVARFVLLRHWVFGSPIDPGSVR